MATVTIQGKDVDVSAIVQEVVRRLQPHLKEDTAPVRTAAPRGGTGGSDGVFSTMDEAVAAALAAQQKVKQMTLDERDVMIKVIREMCEQQAENWGRMEFEESKIGRMDHKIEKLKLVKKVVGVEALRTGARSDHTGVSLTAYAPFGVIGMVTPATHSVPTMAGNAINILAAGNTAVFSPHPLASKCFVHALRSINREIVRKTGVENVICTVEKPSIESAVELFHHKDIALLCVTGGPAVVRSAMKAGKRVIAAGPGNPPVVVDETANLDKAAQDIIKGASFDNNLLCIGEKEVFVLQSVADAFIAAMKRAGAVELNQEQIAKLTQKAFTMEKDKGAGCAQAHVQREFIGRDTSFLAEAAGLKLSGQVDLLFGETDEDHPFVQEEQMMPFVPIVRVPNIDEAIRAAVKAEHGYKHTALIHSNNINNVSRMARAMNTTLFVQNANCAASLGLDGPGYLSYSIATPTGEGVTTPLTFTRQRQLVIGGNLNFT